MVIGKAGWDAAERGGKVGSARAGMLDAMSISVVAAVFRAAHATRLLIINSWTTRAILLVEVLVLGWLVKIGLRG